MTSASNVARSIDWMPLCIPFSNFTLFYRVCFIFIKVSLISFFLISGIIAHKKKQGGFGLVSIILGFYTIIVSDSKFYMSI